MTNRTLILSLISIALVLRPVHSQDSFKINLHPGSVGVISAGKIELGTGFACENERTIITCAHVIAGVTNLSYEPFNKPVKNLRLVFALPRYDLAILTTEQAVCESPFTIGDIKRIRPGERIVYVGFNQKDGLLKAETATVSAVGNVMNDGVIVDFLEFDGNGIPGYSGGPVFSTDGKVIAIMREAWTRRGVKGGDPVLVNRAFSVGLLPVLTREIFSSSSSLDNKQSSTNSALNLIERKN